MSKRKKYEKTLLKRRRNKPGPRMKRGRIASIDRFKNKNRLYTWNDRPFTTCMRQCFSYCIPRKKIYHSHESAGKSAQYTSFMALGNITTTARCTRCDILFFFRRFKWPMSQPVSQVWRAWHDRFSVASISDKSMLLKGHLIIFFYALNFIFANALLFKIVAHFYQNFSLPPSYIFYTYFSLQTYE